jgi:hypothetical protein
LCYSSLHLSMPFDFDCSIRTNNYRWISMTAQV